MYAFGLRSCLDIILAYLRVLRVHPCNLEYFGRAIHCEFHVKCSKCSNKLQRNDGRQCSTRYSNLLLGRDVS